MSCKTLVALNKLSIHASKCVKICKWIRESNHEKRKFKDHETIVINFVATHLIVKYQIIFLFQFEN